MSDLEKRFDPDQPRDSHGRWSRELGGGFHAPYTIVEAERETDPESREIALTILRAEENVRRYESIIQRGEREPTAGFWQDKLDHAKRELAATYAKWQARQRKLGRTPREETRKTMSQSEDYDARAMTALAGLNRMRTKAAEELGTKLLGLLGSDSTRLITTVVEAEALLSGEPQAKAQETLDRINGKASVPNYQAVSPEHKAKLRGLIEHYRKFPHPFTQCVLDNRKRFGPRAEAVCAVLKDIMENTTHWRHGGQPGKAGVVVAPSPPIPTPDDLDALLDATVDRLVEQLQGADEAEGLIEYLERLRAVEPESGKADWTPRLHPRDRHGRFTDKPGGGLPGGGGSGGSTPAAQQIDEHSIRTLRWGERRDVGAGVTVERDAGNGSYYVRGHGTTVHPDTVDDAVRQARLVARLGERRREFDLSLDNAPMPPRTSRESNRVMGRPIEDARLPRDVSYAFVNIDEMLESDSAKGNPNVPELQDALDEAAAAAADFYETPTGRGNVSRVLARLRTFQKQAEDAGVDDAADWASSVMNIVRDYFQSFSNPKFQPKADEPLPVTPESIRAWLALSKQQ